MMQDEENEYLYMIHQKDDDSFKVLIDSYRKVTKRFIYEKSFYSGWMRDTNEIHQISIITLHEAIQTYRDDTSSSFCHFYLCLLKNELIDENRRRNKLYEVVSLDAPIYEGSGIYMKDCIRNNNPRNEADWCIRNDIMKERMKSWTKSLNYKERQIVRLRYYGFTYQEIAYYLHINEKKVDNTIHKMRKRKGMIDYDNTL